LKGCEAAVRICMVRRRRSHLLGGGEQRLLNYGSTEPEKMTTGTRAPPNYWKANTVEERDGHMSSCKKCNRKMVMKSDGGGPGVVSELVTCFYVQGVCNKQPLRL